tara:strand:+ start:54 stop:740 length:687 start_codon:yes stop_codon:yes gene_type:complete
MPALHRTSTILDHQEFVKAVYGLSNDRYFTTPDMLTQMQRFVMRGLKGIRQGDKKKATLNLVVAMSWFMSLMNQLHIDLTAATFKRFPNLCSYCGSRPCACKKQKVKKRKRVVAKNGRKPKTIAEFQRMFSNIYPPESRTLEQSGIHLGEEMGELTEVVAIYRGSRKTKDFEKISQEAADFISCLFGVFNSWKVNASLELSTLFSRNCHVCKKAPCECDFRFITNFKS